MFRTEDKSLKVAEKNIICYKRVNTHKAGYVTSFLISFPYKFGKLYTENNWESTKNDVISAGVAIFGFHSYKKNEPVRKSIKQTVRCIIPKGSEYYENKSEYISNSIIVKSVIK